MTQLTKYMNDRMYYYQQNVTLNGDCLKMCVASLLQVEPEYVPNFLNTGELRLWLSQKGLAVVMTNTVFDDMCQGEELHVIAAVKSKRHAGGKHAIIVGSTVGKPHWRVIFDPNPERGLAYVEQSILTKDELISLLIMSPLVSTFEQWGWR